MIKKDQKVCVFKEGKATVGYAKKIGRKYSTIETIYGKRMTVNTKKLRVCKV